MFKPSRFAVTVALSLTVGQVSSLGCYPAFSSSASYEAGSLVSFNATNYQCVDGFDMWCTGHQPPGEPGQIATVAWSSLGACSGTATLPAPTSKPTPPLVTDGGGGCPTTFAAGTAYDAGEKVEFNSIVYECQGTPGVANWCGTSGYEPEIGTYWSSAWKVLGSCSGVIPPTASPTVNPLSPGCPGAWVSGAEYKTDDEVAIGSLVYKCIVAPYCSVFSPDAVPGGNLGWAKTGSCAGTISPTVSPTVDANAPGCPLAWASGASYEGGDTVSIGALVYECVSNAFSAFCPIRSPEDVGAEECWIPKGSCTGTIAPTTSPTLDPNAPGCPLAFDTNTAYSGGDTCEVAGIVYKCRTDAYGAYCNAGPNYAPGSANSDLGWIKMGSCTGTISPTTSPTHSGADSGGCNHPYAEKCSAGPGTNSVLTGTACLETYKAGVRVEYNQFIFECKSDIHASKYCQWPQYGPDGIYWSMAWNKIGWCDGTLAPTKSPSATPSLAPSAAPSSKPSAAPSLAPSLKPSASPSDIPSLVPSAAPSDVPSAAPSDVPSLKPSAAPSDAPSLKPSAFPSLKPSAAPSDAPSLKPSLAPSKAPSAKPVP